MTETDCEVRGAGDDSWEGASAVVLEVSDALLSLPSTLDCGQAFRWKLGPGGWWTGVVRGRAVRLRREGDLVRGQLYPPGLDAEAFLASYLRMEVDQRALHARFAAADPWIAAAVAAFPGLRVLNQEPQETLLSYVCSTANSVPRISTAVEEMSRRWGHPIAVLDGYPFHAFPTASALANAPEAELREGCGLGWRGDNLKRVAREVADKPEGWPEHLRLLSYSEAKAQLMELRGIGAKIADCVCLFALGKDEAVPVDTHIWAIAKEIFGLQIPTRTLTPATYETVSRLFVDRYGPYAGWAQEYLYLHRRARQGRVKSASRE